MTKLSPSILSADFSRLGQDCRQVLEAGADMLHYDVMDGHFVPNISFGVPVLKSLHAALPDAFYDVHLMIKDPLKYVQTFRDAGADLIVVHAEAEDDPQAVLRAIAARGIKAGICIKPGTQPETIQPLLPLCDLVLVMTVEPGFGGQSFMEEMCPKLHWLREHCRPGTVLQVDGGINRKTIAAAAAAGADCFVAGSAIFGKEDYAAEVAALRALAEQAG